MSDSAVVFLNGEVLPADQARVSVFDRGFLFGDGVYEVIPAYAGRLFRLPGHLARLQRSLDGLALPNPYPVVRWTQLLEDLVRRAGQVDQSVYLQVTRGAATTRTHAYPADLQPTVLAMSSPARRIDPARSARGVAVITHADIRWGRCDIKTTAMVANVLLQQMAREAGVEETLLVRDGLLLEGASSNLFAVCDDVLVTPPTGPWLLPGVTRDLVLELARGDGLAVREADLPVSGLAHWQELWITSGSREIMPVVRVDGLSVGDGRPGPLWRRLRELFGAFRARLERGETSE